MTLKHNLFKKKKIAASKLEHNPDETPNCSTLLPKKQAAA